MIKLISTLSFGILFSCSQITKPDLNNERAEILKMHNAQRDYHFNKDSIAFVDQLSDNFTSVNHGVISKPKKEDILSRYHHYFSSVEFLKWDDLTEPDITFSADGSMAYTVVDKIVVTIHNDENGNPVEGQTHFAWTSIYKKYEDEWKIDCVTSTNEPIIVN
ncbi:MAG: nuclear transport factor 2 family protein [Bacteroidota bacterium]